MYNLVPNANNEDDIAKSYFCFQLALVETLPLGNLICMLATELKIFSIIEYIFFIEECEF